MFSLPHHPRILEGACRNLAKFATERSVSGSSSPRAVLPLGPTGEASEVSVRTLVEAF